VSSFRLKLNLKPETLNLNSFDMNASIAKNETLLGVALAPLDFVRQVGLVIGFSLLTALSAQIVIPVPPVPFTAQTFAVVLTGALLGSRLGAITMIVYLIEGACGLPFFSGGSGGYWHLIGPTGGYLVAFPAAPISPARLPSTNGIVSF